MSVDGLDVVRLGWVSSTRGSSPVAVGPGESGIWPAWLVVRECVREFDGELSSLPEPPKSEAPGIALRRIGPRRRVSGFQAEGGLGFGDDVLRPDKAANRRPMLPPLKIELVEGEEFDGCVASLCWDSREDDEEGKLGN